MAKEPKPLAAGLKWVSERFADVSICFGDGPLIETTLLINGVNSEDCPSRGEQIASQTLEFLRLSERSVPVRAASSFQHDAIFQTKFDALNTATNESEVLAGYVKKDTERYVNRVFKRGNLAVSRDEATRLSRKYILFELAMYAVLADEGYLVDVYFGEEIGTLRHFMYGRISDFPELSGRTFINLKEESPDA